MIPVVSFHALYVAILVVFTAAIRHIEFRFDEVKDLWQGILLASISVGILISRMQGSAICFPYMQHYVIVLASGLS